MQANVLKQLGSTHALIVHGANGLDELSIEGPTLIAELKNDQITEYELTPEQVGLQTGSHRSLQANSVEESILKFQMALNGEGGEITDIVVLNSAAALYVGGVANSIQQGVVLAREAIRSGKARLKLQEFVRLTQQLAQENPQ